MANSAISCAGPKLCLRNALQTIRRIYSLPTFVGTFEEIARRQPIERWSWRFHRRFRAALPGRVMLFLYGIMSFMRARVPAAANGVLALAIYPNERRELDQLAVCVPSIPFYNVSLAPLNCVSPSSLALLFAVMQKRRKLSACWRIAVRAGRDWHFLTAFHAVSLLFYYLRFKEELTRRRPRAVIISTASLPAPQALIWAARSLRIPSIFSAHAMPSAKQPLFIPPTDLMLLDGEVALEECLKGASHPFSVILKGLHGEPRALRFQDLAAETISIGFFLTAPVNESGLRSAVQASIAKFAPRKIIVRPHPVAMLSPDLFRLFHDIPQVRIVNGRTLEECLAMCNLIIAGNSSVHLQVLKGGIPAVYLPTLDTPKEDSFGFVRGRIVFGCRNLEELNLSDLSNFYTAEWEARFKRFDASYMEAPESRAKRIEEALADFLADS